MLNVCRKFITVDESHPSSTTVTSKPWIPELKLCHSDKKILLATTGWLNDQIINAAQQLLRKQFPLLSGLQNVTLGLVMSFEIPGKEFIQILHSPVNHWVTVSTIGIEESNQIILFDSKYVTLTTLLNAQIACLLNTIGDKIEVNIVDVQSQVGLEFVQNNNYDFFLNRLGAVTVAYMLLLLLLR